MPRWAAMPATAAAALPGRPPRLDGASYLRCIEERSARFTDLLAATEPGRQVPTCPEWDAADLLWHLVGVQWFWGSLAGGHHVEPAAARDDRPARPEEFAELVALQRHATSRLLEALQGGADDQPLWTWFPAEQTRGFVRRRQAHEVLIHTLDAEAVADADHLPLDPAMAADGVDEAISVIFSAESPDGEVTTTAPPVALATADTGASWLAQPASSRVEEHDEPFLLVLPSGSVDPVARVVADAATLDRWIWNRAPDDAVVRTGDPAALAALLTVLRSA